MYQLSGITIQERPAEEGVTRVDMTHVEDAIAELLRHTPDLSWADIRAINDGPGWEDELGHGDGSKDSARRRADYLAQERTSRSTILIGV